MNNLFDLTLEHQEWIDSYYKNRKEIKQMMREYKKFKRKYENLITLKTSIEEFGYTHEIQTLIKRMDPGFKEDLSTEEMITRIDTLLVLGNESIGRFIGKLKNKIADFFSNLTEGNKKVSDLVKEFSDKISKSKINQEDFKQLKVKCPPFNNWKLLAQDTINIYGIALSYFNSVKREPLKNINFNYPLFPLPDKKFLDMLGLALVGSGSNTYKCEILKSPALCLSDYIDDDTEQFNKRLDIHEHNISNDWTIQNLLAGKALVLKYIDMSFKEGKQFDNKLRDFWTDTSNLNRIWNNFTGDTAVERQLDKLDEILYRNVKMMYWFGDYHIQGLQIASTQWIRVARAIWSCRE